MGLLDGFEKLINEHGSAAILKERISLANDKYAALELKLSECEARTKEAVCTSKKIESENTGLRVDLEKANFEIQNLKKLIEQNRGQRLDEIKEKILMLLATQDDYEGNMARALNIGQQVAAFHLEDLAEMEFIYRSLSMTGEVFPWRLIQEGRRYLITHGLIA